MKIRSFEITDQKQIAGGNFMFVGDELAKKGFAGIMESLTGKPKAIEAEYTVDDDE